MVREHVPVEVEGDPTQYAINRTPEGWVIELVSNRGVTKRGGRPAVVDPEGKVRVVLQPRTKCDQAKAWRSGRVHAQPGRLELELGPGAVEFVEFMDPCP